MPTPALLRIVAAILFSAFGPALQAQLAEWADQRSEEIRLERALPVGGGRWAVIGTTTFGGSNMISVRNGDGLIAWETVDYYFTGHGLGDVIMLPDSGLLHVGAVDGCDYISAPSRLRRYAPDGTVVWEQMIGAEWTGLVTMCAKGATDLLAVASEDSVYVMDLDGNPVEGDFSPGGTIRTLHWQGDSAIFVVTNAVTMRVDLDGNVLNSSPIGAGSMDIHWDGQRLFVLGNDGILRFDQELNQLGTTPLPSLDQNSAFIVSESGLFVNSTAGLHELASDGSVTLLFPWPALPELTTTGCAVREGEVLAVGNTNISGRRTGIIRRLSIAGGAAQHDEDVEVLLQVDSTWTEFIGGPYWRSKADITGIVVNHGSATLNDVVLSMWIQVPYLMCDHPTNRIVATGLALAPGDSAILPFGVVDVAQYLTANQIIAEDEICIVALAPDHLADRDPTDNTACVAVTFALGEAESNTACPLLLAPNPASGICILSGLTWLGTDVRIQVLDATGRMMVDRAIPATADSTSAFDVSGLPPGAYVLVAGGERSRARMGFIVSHP